MRYKVAEVLDDLMGQDDNIYFLTGDLGYNIFNNLRDKYPSRAINVGASEQLMLAMAVGLADSGKIPFVYSITPFLLYRPFEIIRTYINHERSNIKLIGCGRDSDYAHDGFTHFAGDDKAIMDTFDNIICEWPTDKPRLENIIRQAKCSPNPYYINITR